MSSESSHVIGDKTTTQPNQSTPTTAITSTTNTSLTSPDSESAVHVAITSSDPTTTTDLDATTTYLNCLQTTLQPHADSSTIPSTNSSTDLCDDFEERLREMRKQLLVTARERHIAAGFSESNTPTEIPQPFESPLWEAIVLAETDPEEKNRRVQALVGQPYFIEDDEWVGLCESGCAAALRILRDHGFRPTVKAAGSGITDSCRRSLGLSPEAALEILRPLLEVTNSYGSEFARATAESGGESACTIARQTCEANDLSNDHDLVRVITQWCKEQTGHDW